MKSKTRKTPKKLGVHDIKVLTETPDDRYVFVKMVSRAYDLVREGLLKRTMLVYALTHGQTRAQIRPAFCRTKKGRDALAQAKLVTGGVT